MSCLPGTYVSVIGSSLLRTSASGLPLVQIRVLVMYIRYGVYSLYVAHADADRPGTHRSHSRGCYPEENTFLGLFSRLHRRHDDTVTVLMKPIGSALSSPWSASSPRSPKPGRPTRESRRIHESKTLTVAGWGEGGFCFLGDDGDTTGDAALRGMRQIPGWQG